MSDITKIIEDSTGDSGFISGDIHIDSCLDSDSQIDRESQSERKNNERPESHDFDMKEENTVCTDSGVISDVTENLSDLNIRESANFKSFEIPQDSNRLSSTNQSRKHEKLTKSQNLEDPWEQDRDGNTKLHRCIVEDNTTEAINLISKVPHPRLLDTPNDDCETPLHLAVETRQLKVIRCLLMAGAQPSPRDSEGNSPLHIASKYGDLECAKALLHPIGKEDAKTPLRKHYVRPKMEQWNYVGQTSVHMAAIHGQAKMLLLLSNYGADINSREGCSGYTALHIAVENRDNTLIDILLSLPQLDVEQSSYGGKSALQISSICPKNIQRKLEKNGVSPCNSEDEFDSSDDDDIFDNEYENAPSMFVGSNLVGASA